MREGWDEFAIICASGSLPGSMCPIISARKRKRQSPVYEDDEKLFRKSETHADPTPIKAVLQCALLLFSEYMTQNQDRGRYDYTTSAIPQTPKASCLCLMAIHLAR
jgi:hypothetical protein